MTEDTNTNLQDETLNELEPQTVTVTPSDANETLAEEPTEQTSSKDELQALQARIQRIDAALKKANNDAKAHRIENEELRKYKEEQEASKLNDQERQEAARKKLEQQLADTQTQFEARNKEYQTYKVNAEIKLQAAQLGIIDQKSQNVIMKLIERDAIEYDENGDPTNIQALLNALKEDVPGLVPRRSVSSGGATNPPRSVSTMPQEITADYIGKLKPAEYDNLSAEQKAKIQQFMLKPNRK